MKLLPIVLCAALFSSLLADAGCTRTENSGNAESTATPTSAATVEAVSSAPAAVSSGAAQQPASAVSTQPVAYTDLNGVIGQTQIVDLAKLGVFGPANGSFNPNGTITRADFVHWLVSANNAIWSSEPNRLIRPAQGGSSAYPDVPATHPDFPYIQGMYDAGFAVGFPDKTFKPDAPLTHEQMIAIKESVDRNGVDKYYVDFWEATMPNWKDRLQINKMFRGAIAEDYSLDRSNANGRPQDVIDNVGRAFGAIAMFRPQQPVTRSQAALVVWKIGAHTDKSGASDAPRSAADALAPAPSPSPS